MSGTGRVDVDGLVKKQGEGRGRVDVDSQMEKLVKKTG